MARKTIQSHKLFTRAKKVLVGGVDSPVRSFAYVGTEPPVISHGRGAYICDEDGNKYTDYVLSWGAAILGHAHPAVLKDVKTVVGKGFHFGATTKPEIDFAREITAAIPFMDKIRFTNSGTEAVMGAIRLARGFTGRDFILKFENAYHGHADYLLAQAGSGLATQGIPTSQGVPKDFVRNTLVVPVGDGPAVERAFKKYGQRLAAVIVEPVGGNHGVIPPDVKFLEKLCSITRAHGTVLIFDEVITGFRFHYGAVASMLGIMPDLICLGKIIGGGFPVGAYGGQEKIMRHLAPRGDVYQGSTFAGNPVVMQAGLSTLRVLSSSPAGYSRSQELAAYLTAGLKRVADQKGVFVQINSSGSMFSLRFKEKEIFARVFRNLLDNGVYLAPSEFEANFVSFLHTPKNIERTISVFEAAL